MKNWIIVSLGCGNYLTAVFLKPQLKLKIQPFLVEGSVSLILDPIQRIFSISAFLKVIHTPKSPMKRGWIKCRENGLSTFGQLTLNMGVFILSMVSPDCKDIKISLGEVHFCGTWFTPSFRGFWGRGWPFKRLKWKNP